MEVAADVLAAIDPSLTPPRSVRDGGAPPRAVRAGLADLPELAREELAAIGEGRVGVVVPDALYGRAAALFPGQDLDAPVTVLTVTRAKGLEFDAVIVADPAAILAQSPNGAQDLYVAITRATRRLTVACEGELPPSLSRLTT
ncbi:ATP-binding domain-containing protein [Nonomuraea ferruginea]